MPKVHHFQRYSSPENATTNNTLQLISRIYSYSSIQASTFLKELVGESVDSIPIGMEIRQQTRGAASTPDGLVSQSSFKILIESKVDSPIDPDQLVRHASSFSGESQKIVLLLTKQPLGAREESEIRERIEARHPEVVFAASTFEDVCNTAKGLFKAYEYEMREVVEDYEEYCNETGLYDQSPYLMRIVPCGKSVEINRRYGIYFHPSDRGYTDHRYVGIYANKAVQLIWEIDAAFDVECDGERVDKTLIQGRDTDEYDEKLLAIIRDARRECGYEIESGHRFFCGEPHETDFRKVSPGGIQGARFVNLKKRLGGIEEPSTIAQRLRRETWE